MTIFNSEFKKVIYVANMSGATMAEEGRKGEQKIKE